MSNAISTLAFIKAMGSGGGSSYTAGNGIEIDSGAIKAKVDGTTIGFDADGKLKTIGSSSDDTFIAIHGETTIEQLDAAYAAGKNIICKGFYEDSKKKKPGNDEYSYLYMNLDWATSYNNNTYYEFTCTDCDGYIYTTYRLSSEEQWGDIKCIEPGGGGGSSSEKIIISGTGYYNSATFKNKNNGVLAVAYYNYDDDTYTEYDFTYQMMHVTDFSGSITNGVLSIGHEQAGNNIKITMTGTIVSNLTVSISVKQKNIWNQRDGCYEVIWSGEDSSGNTISGSACFFGSRDDNNALLTDIKISADGVNFTNATVEGTIKASK